MIQPKDIYKTVAVLATIVVLFASVYGLQHKIDSKPRMPTNERLLLSFPSGDYLKSVALGFNSVIADLIWAHTMVTVGEHLRTKPGERLDASINHALDIITVLDPLFHDAYNLGSILLAMQADKVDESIILLERGIKNYPEDWRLYFIMGFNYTYYKKDDATALKYYEQVAKLPGHPTYISRLIGNLYANIGKIDMSLVFLEEAYKTFKDEKMREEIAKKIKGLLVEKHTLILKDVAKKYKSIYGMYPHTLEALTQTGLIPTIPDEPYGGRYVIDSQTGEVTIESESKNHSDDGNELPAEDLPQKLTDDEFILENNKPIYATKTED